MILSTLDTGPKAQGGEGHNGLGSPGLGCVYPNPVGSTHSMYASSNLSVSTTTPLGFPPQPRLGLRAKLVQCGLNDGSRELCHDSADIL